MKRTFATIYAVFCTLLLAAGFLLVFAFAWKAGSEDTLKGICGLVLGFILAPTLHELGHVCFAQIAKMDYVYVKFFCFQCYIKNGKKKIGIASPFAPDETQVLPLKGGNMQRRAAWYALGGLIFGGVFLLCVLAAAIMVTALVRANYLLWGLVPYALYLVALNIAPFEYASGKTDALVYIGIKKGYDAERTMLSAMEIQGQLSEGKSFAEIDEKWYFDVPQLCEDEPLFAVMLDLRYRYYMEKGNLPKAVECLNRLVSISTYMTKTEFEKVAAELVYINALRGEKDEAEENGKACRAFLQSETPTAKRILAAWAQDRGEKEFVDALLSQAERCFENERIAGVRKFENILLARMKKEENG